MNTREEVERYVADSSVGGLFRGARRLDHGEDWSLEFSNREGKKVQLEVSRDCFRAVVDNLTEQRLFSGFEAD